MKKADLKHVFIATLIPLIIYCVVVSIRSSIKYEELNFLGVVFFIYYIIPMAFFVTLYDLLLKFSLKKTKLFFLSKIYGKVILSILLGILFFAAWLLYAGNFGNYLDMGVGKYLIVYTLKSWMFILYFGIAIPLTFSLSRIYIKT